MIKKYIVQKKDQGKRLDQVVLSLLPNITRTSSKKLLMDGIIKVNDEQLRPNYKVKEQDLITYNEEGIDKFLNLEDHSYIKPVKMDIEVIYEDDNTLVVNKPSGLTTHPVPGHREDTLLNGLVHYQNENNLSGKLRPVHRLDKDTSGVILFAKSKEAHDFYSKQFEQNKVQKTYYAVVKGDFRKYLKDRNKEYIIVQNYLARSTKNRKLMVSVSPQLGQVAVTNIFFEKYWKGLKGTYSLVKVEPKTGRTHQIRVHLAGLRFPVVGDPFYSRERYKRLMLHAYSLVIKNFGGEEITFTAKLPDSFI